MPEKSPPKYSLLISLLLREGSSPHERLIAHCGIDRFFPDVAQRSGNIW